MSYDASYYGRLSLKFVTMISEIFERAVENKQEISFTSKNGIRDTTKPGDKYSNCEADGSCEIRFIVKAKESSPIAENSELRTQVECQAECGSPPLTACSSSVPG